MNKEQLQQRKNDKKELIKLGSFDTFRYERKNQYNEIDEGTSKLFVPSKCPQDYNLENDYQMELCESLLASTKKKKKYYRKVTRLMFEYYKHVAMIELGFKDGVRDKLKIDTIRKYIERMLSERYGHWWGRLELSEKGFIHFHGLISWNDDNFTTFKSLRDGHINTLVNDTFIRDNWYGVSTHVEGKIKPQPSLYGIYDIVLLEQDKNGHKKTSNYIMKDLNSASAYVTKQDEFNESDFEVDKDVLVYVNMLNTMSARNTPIQDYIKHHDQDIKFIRRICKIADGKFFDAHKFGSPNDFIEWYEQNKDIEFFRNFTLYKFNNVTPLGIVPIPKTDPLINIKGSVMEQIPSNKPKRAHKPKQEPILDHLRAVFDVPILIT